MQFCWFNSLSSKSVILNRAKEYYQNDKERLRRQARDKYSNLSEEELNKKRDNMSEERKTNIKRISKKLLRGWKVSI